MSTLKRVHRWFGIQWQSRCCRHCCLPKSNGCCWGGLQKIDQLWYRWLRWGLIHRAEGLGCELVYIISLNSGDKRRNTGVDSKNVEYWRIVQIEAGRHSRRWSANDWNQMGCWHLLSILARRLVGIPVITPLEFSESPSGRVGETVHDVMMPPPSTVGFEQGFPRLSEGIEYWRTC